jgi:hypothetical protein
MIGGIVVKKQGATPGILAKERNRIQRDAFYEIGSHWHAKMLPKHFTRQAFTLYRDVYQPRKPRYERRKFRRFGHTYPLVYSGESMRLALSIRDVRATSRGNRVVLHSRRFNMRHPKSKINMREEVTFISQTEDRGLGLRFDREFQDGIDSIRTSEETKVV